MGILMSVDQATVIVGSGKRVDLPELAFNFCKEEPRSFTVPDLFVILSYYNTAIRSDHRPQNPNSDAITTVKIWQPDVFDEIVANGPPKRTIFRSWPRSPSSKPSPRDRDYRGKTTPNGLPWGATVFDFYYIRQPDHCPAWKVCTGSQLLEWSQANGEEDWAKDEIEWAKREEEPHVIEPCAPYTFLAEQEENIKARKEGWGISMHNGKGAVLNSIDLATDHSIFNTSNYPSPWPLFPFSYPTECLQTRIPLHKLPKKITVHDPWNLLAMYSRNRYGSAKMEVDEANWNEKPDIVHTYNLQLSAAGEARLREEILEAKARSVTSPVPKMAESAGGPTGLHGYFLIAHADVSPGPIAPPVFVVHDPPPTLHPSDPVEKEPTQDYEATNEAHLYLSPAYIAGDGNHSIVYQGEWELPRTAFIPPLRTDPVLCKDCVGADVKRILLEEDGENGEKMEERWKEKSAVLRRTVSEDSPSIGVKFAYDGGLDTAQESNVGDDIYPIDPRKTTCRVEINGPVRPIRTTVGWQDPSNPTCEHLLAHLPTPPTAKFRVMAKLSLEGDYHLWSEARNYQTFDQHMFEHWSGLNKLPEENLCSVGALVPQFYGYYVPQLKDDEKEGHVTRNCSIQGDNQTEGGEEMPKVIRGYLSPILLIEDCGESVSFRQLSVHEQNEVVALILRFNLAGWAHQSVAERNIVVQPGPFNVLSKERKNTEGPGERSFRLIDFGRSSSQEFNGREINYDKRSLQWS